jgi:hypothetical protein
MDPLTAFTAIVTALLEFMTEVVRGQTPEQRAKIWDFYIADVERWRKLFKLD